MSRIEVMYTDRFGSSEQAVTTADCVLFPTVKFARLLYDVELTGLPHLKRFNESFEKRPSAEPEGILCDENFKLMASH